MPAIVRWSRRSGVQRSRRVEQLAERRWVGPRFRAERGERLILVELLRAQQLHPGGLLGAELAQAQLAPVRDPQGSSRDVRSRGPARLSYN